MIGPNDPRHGTNPGYNAGCRQPCCKHAHMVWMKKYRLYGATQTIPATGTHRRIQALAAIGHTLAQIAGHAGKHRTWTNHTLNHNRVRPTTAQLIEHVYNQLHMQPQTGWIADRTRRQATAQGWAPPLAWNNIDTDPKPPHAKTYKGGLDHAAIQRVLDGDTTVPLTTAERHHIIRTLHARGYTDAQIQNTTGIKQNTAQATRKRLGLPPNRATIHWADYGQPNRRNNRNEAA